MEINGLRLLNFLMVEMIMQLRTISIQACVKILEKISMKIIPHELRENEVERELTIYLTQCVLHMYRDYLDKKRREINFKKGFHLENNMNDDVSMDCNDEENKECKEELLGAGDKYIIRKLVSLKVSPEHIDEYLNMLISRSCNSVIPNMQPVINYANFAPNLNQFVYENQTQLAFPQWDYPQRSNSFTNTNFTSSFIDLQSYWFNDWHSIQKEISIDKNFNSTNPLSSLPLHMRWIRPVRSQSINRLPNNSSYMKDSFLFDKVTQAHSKDDNTLEKEYSPLFTDNQESKPFKPRVLKYNEMDVENLSSSSISSQSSAYSFSDVGSASSLDLSFDEFGMPYLKSFKASAFSKFQNNDNSEQSSSVSDQSCSDSEGIPKRMYPIPDNPSSKRPPPPKFGKKSSFFRLKEDNDRERNMDDIGD